MKQPCLLILDDYLPVAKAASYIARSKGWSVLMTSAPREALALVCGGSVDVLLTDYQMPHMNGLEVAEKLRLQGQTLPIILMAAYPSKIFLEEAKRLKISTVLEKDFLMTELESALQELRSR